MVKVHNAIRIQVNNKRLTIRFKRIDDQFKPIHNRLVGVSVWHKGQLKFGTTFLILSTPAEVKKWVRDFILNNSEWAKKFIK